MMNQLYSKKVMDHFHHPRNMGEMKNADGVATVGNPQCGDVMRMYLRVGKREVRSGEKAQKNTSDGGRVERSGTSDSCEVEEFIKDIKFQTLGCGAAIASSSVATEMIKGKSLESAKKVTNKDVLAALGELPKSKIHCSVLAQEAIGKAIEDYKKKQKT